MNACPASLCPQFIGQGCRCPVSQATDDDIPEVIDMRDPDRRHYPDLYVDPIDDRPPFSPAWYQLPGKERR